MFDPKKFTTTKIKPLPVYLLLDVSGSMAGEKLTSLNTAIAEMLNSFSSIDVEFPINIAILLFGTTSNVFLPPSLVKDIKWKNLELDQGSKKGHSIKGVTPMGVTLIDAKEMIEDKKLTPSHAYRPLIILVSDGKPNKGWEEPLDDFINSGRSSKCDRMAMAIGKKADRSILKEFIADANHELFEAGDASQIVDFFNFVTMSITKRTQSTNPNMLPDTSEVESGF